MATARPPKSVRRPRKPQRPRRPSLQKPKRPDLDPASIEAKALDQASDLVVHLGRERLYLPEDTLATRHRIGGREVVVGPEGGVFTLREQRIAASVTGVRWGSNGGLRLTGRCVLDLAKSIKIVLTSQDRVDERVFPARGVSGGFEADLAPLAVESHAGCLPLPAGGYELSLRTPEGDLRLEYEPPLPSLGVHRHRELTLAAGVDRSAVLTVGVDLAADERGHANQRRLREDRYPLFRGESLREAVFFDSYTGKQFSDSPKAIYEELVRQGADLRYLWNVRDGQVEVPDGVTPIRLHGKDYYEAMARSRYIVTNAHLPAWFRRREGQRVLQTWHGSTLKRIGFDLEKIPFAKPDYHERLAVEIAQWDYLISPSPWCTPILRDAFRFEGRMLETGYPRNDVLSRPELAALIRRRLGLPHGRKVILYAPTWRDDRAYGKGRYRFDLRLDLELMREELGEDHILLIRRHPNIADVVGPAGENPFILDVSTYPDIQELYLVADLLITDYSSAMFDFAVTGRPMLFYTYDLEHYRDELRGFYFDFEAAAPGPLLRTSAEVAEAVRGIDAVAREHLDRYADFVARFCPLDDGGAAARAVREVFDLGDGQEAAWTCPDSSREWPINHAR